MDAFTATESLAADALGDGSAACPSKLLSPDS